jgi:hypothetical protein
MQEPTQQPAPRKTIHIGYVIAAIIIIIVAIVCAVIFWPSPGPITPTPTPTPTVTPTPTPTPITKVTVSIVAPATASKSAKYFNVSVNVSQISNFASSTCDIKYDPKVIAVDNIFTGKINDMTVPMRNWSYIPASTQGTVRIFTLDPSLSGINGEGYLFILHFKIIGAVNSSSAISFIQTQTDPESNLRLSTVIGNEIPSTWVNGSVTIIK